MRKLLSDAVRAWQQRAEIRECLKEISAWILAGARNRIKEKINKPLSHIPHEKFLSNPQVKKLNILSKTLSLPQKGAKRFGELISGMTGRMGASMSPALRRVQNSHAALAVGLGITLVASGFGLWFLVGPRVVVVNGVPVAVVENEAAYRTALEKAIAVKTGQLSGLSVEVTDKVELKLSFSSQVESESELVNILASELNYDSVATAIVVDGQPKVLVATEAEAQTVLDRLKEKYLKLYPADGVLNVGFAEEVTLVPIRASAAEVVTADQALQRIEAGEQQAVEYTIKEGDSLWVIARRNNMRVSELHAANPGLDEDCLQNGQIIKLVNPAPLINVVSTMEVKEQREIPFETESKPDNEKYRGYKKVTQPGVPGSKEVVLQVVSRNGQPVEEKVLSETVLKEPVKQVEVTGTKAVVASRSSDTGVGRLGWPLRGQITSRFGKRGGGYHTGLDIDGSTGDPIYAAEDGKVIEAGWEGSYGREVVIDHGGGLLTRYAHCSSTNVKVGQKVSRGDMIARVGSTGRSTGSHLHFEVIVNGSARNPLNYLK